MSARRVPIPRRAMAWIGDHKMEIGVGAIVVFVVTVFPLIFFAERRHQVRIEQAVTDRVDAFVVAIADGQGETACAMLADPAQEALVERVGPSVRPRDQRRTCEEVVRAAAIDRLDAEARALRRIEVVDVDYEQESRTDGFENEGLHFESATATAHLPTGRIALETESPNTDEADRWAINSIDPILDLMTEP